MWILIKLSSLLWVYTVEEASKIWASRQETCLEGFVNNKGTDQPVHSHSLICTFVIRLFKSIIYRLTTSKNLTLSETPKAGFVAMRSIF